MTDFLDEKKLEIAVRLKELRPLVDEFHRLEAAAAALEGVAGGGDGTAPKNTTSVQTPRRRGKAKAKTATATTTTGASRGRPKGSGTRSKQALAAVQRQPGITVSELAQKMDVAQNYLYRIMPELQKSGLIRKEGRGWHPVATD